MPVYEQIVYLHNAMVRMSCAPANSYVEILSISTRGLWEVLGH